MRLPALRIWQRSIRRPTELILPKCRRNRRWGSRCARIFLRCGGVFPLNACPNCSSEGFSPGLNAEGVIGLFCKDCEKGFTYWKCELCGTDNPISKSLAKEEEGGCFVATAACGCNDAPEVLALRAFHDAHLTRTRTGRNLVRAYYALSPPLENLIAGRGWLRSVVRTVLVKPLAQAAKLIGVELDTARPHRSSN